MNFPGRSLDSSPLDAAVEAFEELLDKEGGATPDEVATVATKMYEECLAKWRPVIQGLPQALPKLGNDLGTALAGLAGLMNTVIEHPGLEAEIQRLQRYRARAAFAKYQAYREAGFGRITALLLVLASTRSSFPINLRAAVSGP